MKFWSFDAANAPITMSDRSRRDEWAVFILREKYQAGDDGVCRVTDLGHRGLVHRGGLTFASFERVVLQPWHQLRLLALELTTKISRDVGQGVPAVRQSWLPNSPASCLTDLLTQLTGYPPPPPPV